MSSQVTHHHFKVTNKRVESGIKTWTEICSKCNFFRHRHEWMFKIPDNSGCPVVDPVPTMYGVFSDTRLLVYNYDANTRRYSTPAVENIPFSKEDYARIRSQYGSRLLNNCLVQLELLYADYEIPRNAKYPLIELFCKMDGQKVASIRLNFVETIGMDIMKMLKAIRRKF